MKHRGGPRHSVARHEVVLINDSHRVCFERHEVLLSLLAARAGLWMRERRTPAMDSIAENESAETVSCSMEPPLSRKDPTPFTSPLLLSGTHVAPFGFGDRY